MSSIDKGVVMEALMLQIVSIPIIGAIILVALHSGFRFIGARTPSELIAATITLVILTILGVEPYKAISLSVTFYVVAAEMSMSLDHELINALKENIKLINRSQSPPNGEINTPE